MAKTIALVHGAWLNSKAWENWKPRYEQRGYTIVAPDWPGDEGDPVDLKARPRKELIKYGPKQIVAHFERSGDRETQSCRRAQPGSTPSPSRRRWRSAMYSSPPTRRAGRRATWRATSCGCRPCYRNAAMSPSRAR